MGLGRLKILVAAIATACFLVPAADAAPSARPPVVWLKGEGNFTKSHRPMHSIDRIVVHVTEGAFWGSVHWLKSPRAHASSHFIVSRRGKIVQLVHLSDIAWHAGHWKTNAASVGIEHEGFTYGPGGFSDAAVPSLCAPDRVDRTPLAAADRPRAHHRPPRSARRTRRPRRRESTTPILARSWQWNRYLRLVRLYAVARFQKLSVTPVVPAGPVRGVIPWRAEATGGIRQVEFSINGRVVWIDRRAPFAYAGGLNTTKLGNGRHVLQVHGVAGPGRYDIARRTIVVDNKAFALTSAGARPWTKVRGPVKLRVRPWGAKAAAMTFKVNGVRRASRPTPSVPLHLERDEREGRQARARRWSRPPSTGASRNGGFRSSPRNASSRSRSRR